MLHLIFQSPIQTAVLERIAPDDDVVFLESSVLRLLEKGNMKSILAPLLKHNKLYVLKEDVDARGIQASELIVGIAMIDYKYLVELTVKNPLIQTWN